MSLMTLSSASINKVLQSDLIQWLHLLQPLFFFVLWLHHDKFHRNRMHKSWFGDDKFKFCVFSITKYAYMYTFYDAQTPESKTFILCCLWFVPLTHHSSLVLVFFLNCHFNFYHNDVLRQFKSTRKYTPAISTQPISLYISFSFFFLFRCV